MIPLAIPNLLGNEKKYLNQCIEENFVSTVGPFIKEFEMHIAKWAGTEQAIAVNSGTSALHLALIAAGVKEGDLVLVPNLSFIATVNAITYCFADTWFIDIEEQTWGICPKKLEKELIENTIIKDGNLIHKQTSQRVSAIIAVYTLGCPPKLDELNEISKKYKIPLIADAAAAIGATYKERPIGNLADYTTFSFNGNKIITSGGGGGIVCRNNNDYKEIRHISTTARVGDKYIHDKIGYNYRMTNIQAALGCAQFENLNFFLNKKNEIQNKYIEMLSHHKCLSFFPSPQNSRSTNWFSGIVLNENASVQPATFIEKLREKNIDIREFWRPLSNQAQFINSLHGNLEYSNKLWNRIMCLPSSTSITNDELTYVAEAINSILKK